LLTFAQTTGKTLEEIDLIFARKELRDSAVAKRTIHRRSSGFGTEDEKRSRDIVEEERVTQSVRR
jgi:hypothetical protein